ncbi:hypothetical protein ACJX0J_013403, partial [Zea mays]
GWMEDAEGNEQSISPVQNGIDTNRMQSLPYWFDPMGINLFIFHFIALMWDHVVEILDLAWGASNFRANAQHAQ